MYLIIHFLALFVFFFAEYSLSAILPIYVTEYLHYEPSYAGYTVGIFAFSALISKFCFGFLADRLGTLKVYAAGLLATGFIVFLYGFANTLLLVFLIRFLQGASSGIVRTGYQPITVSLTSQQNLGKTLGFIGLAAVIGMMVGSPFSIKVIEILPMKPLFTLMASFYIAAFIIALFIKIPDMGKVSDKFSIYGFIEKSVLPFALLRFINAACYGVFLSYGILFARQTPGFNSGYIITVYALSNILMRPLAGYIFDTFSRPMFILLSGYIMLGAGYAIFSMSSAIIIGAFLIGMGSGMEYTGLNCAAFKKAGEKSLNKISTTMEVAFSAGMSAGGILTGLFYQGSLQLLFSITAAVYIVPIVLLFILLRKW